MRKQLQALTLEQVNAAIKRHLSARDLSVVFITKDAAGTEAGARDRRLHRSSTTGRSRQTCSAKTR